MHDGSKGNQPTRYSHSCSWNETTSSWSCPLDKTHKTSRTSNDDFFGEMLMKTIESEIAKSSNELASGSDSQTGFGASTTKSGLTDIGIPSMDESLSKLDIPAFEEIDTSNKDIVGLKNLGGKTKINFDKVTPKTDMKVLDNLGIFKNDAAEEFKQKKVLETLQPRVDSMEDVKVANIEQQIDSVMPTQAETAIAANTQMPDIMSNPDEAIQNIEKDIIS